MRDIDRRALAASATFAIVGLFRVANQPQPDIWVAVLLAAIVLAVTAAVGAKSHD